MFIGEEVHSPRRITLSLLRTKIVDSDLRRVLKRIKIIEGYIAIYFPPIS